MSQLELNYTTADFSSVVRFELCTDCMALVLWPGFLGHRTVHEFGEALDRLGDE